ncbi:Uncharacterised protein [Bordetella pertussis]|nr:Uncharacterised protein [Bordetella pertussis]CFP64549.1 Uncharacterised protein [Bordetella pertussis]
MLSGPRWRMRRQLSASTLALSRKGPQIPTIPHMMFSFPR